MKPVDVHCHLDFDRFDEDREEVIERASEKLEFVVNAGCNYDRNQNALELQKKYPDTVVANLGLHPTFESSFDQLDRIKSQIRENDPVAIGEIGLDHHHITDNSGREQQKEVFEEMLSLAEKMNKPVVVHTREAEEQAVDMLKNYSLPEIILHCFNGSPELAEEATESGMTIGVTTQVLYSSRVQNIVRRLDVEEIVLETDSPFLYPNGRNEPVNVLESAEKIAEIKGMEIDEVVEITSSNAEETFR